jgi:hypothetical protein
VFSFGGRQRAVIEGSAVTHASWIFDADRRLISNQERTGLLVMLNV